MNKICILGAAALIATAFLLTWLLPSAVVEECAEVGSEASTAVGWVVVSGAEGWAAVSAGARSAVAFGERQ